MAEFVQQLDLRGHSLAMAGYLNYLFLAQTVPAPELLKNFLIVLTSGPAAEALDKSPAQRRTVRCTTPPAASAKPLRRATGDAPPELVEAENNAKAARRGVLAEIAAAALR